MRRYVGLVEGKVRSVSVEDGAAARSLPPGPVQFSVTKAFDWGGFARAETAQLSFALCFDALGGNDAEPDSTPAGVARSRALNVVHVFKWNLVRLNWRTGFLLTQAEVLAMVMEIELALTNRVPRVVDAAAGIDLSPF